MKENLKIIGLLVICAASVIFIIATFFFEPSTKKNVMETDGHQYDRVYRFGKGTIVHSPECEICAQRIDSLMKANQIETLRKVDSILTARGLIQ